MATTFENFLARHKPAVIDQMSVQIQKTITGTGAEAALKITNSIVDFYYGRILGTLPLDDPLTQSILSAALTNKTSRETMAQNRTKFFEIMHELCGTDTTMSKAEQEHVDRILIQSQKVYDKRYSYCKAPKPKTSKRLSFPICVIVENKLEQLYSCSNLFSTCILVI